MILLDTNVLVALVDERDLAKLRGPFGVPSAVLAEACFLLEAGYLRQRLHLLLSRLQVQALEPDPPWWRDVFAWLQQYDEHAPDLTDAMLAIMSARVSASIWTYDSEFRTLWRRPDGKHLKVLPESSRR